MIELKVIGWFLGLIVSIYLVFMTIGINGLVNMFPEGKRWWHIFAQFGSLILFATLVLYYPFKGR